MFSIGNGRYQSSSMKEFHQILNLFQPIICQRSGEFPVLPFFAYRFFLANLTLLQSTFSSSGGFIGGSKERHNHLLLNSSLFRSPHYHTSLPSSGREKKVPLPILTASYQEGQI